MLPFLEQPVNKYVKQKAKKKWESGALKIILTKSRKTHKVIQINYINQFK